MTLDELVELGNRVNAVTRTMGMALTSCTPPAKGSPLFELGDDEMEMGVGIHGEPGRRREKLADANAIVDELVEAVASDLPYESGDDVALMINGLGGTPISELYILYGRAHDQLAERGHQRDAQLRRRVLHVARHGRRVGHAGQARRRAQRAVRRARRGGGPRLLAARRRILVILLARHGQTTENAAGRILGRRDPPLSPEGRTQAIELARTLEAAGLRALWTSPLRRAHETADIVGAELSLHPVVLAELVESGRGTWEGKRVADLARDSPALFAAFETGDPAFAFPGGESLREQLDRTRLALEQIGRGPLPALAVTHAGTIRAALAIHGRPIPPERALAHGRALSFDVTS